MLYKLEIKIRFRFLSYLKKIEILWMIILIVLMKYVRFSRHGKIANSDLDHIDESWFLK